MAGLITLAGVLLGGAGLSLIADHSTPQWEVVVRVNGEVDAALTRQLQLNLYWNANVCRWIGWAVFWGALIGGTMAVLSMFGV